MVGVAAYWLAIMDPTTGNFVYATPILPDAGIAYSVQVPPSRALEPGKTYQWMAAAFDSIGWEVGLAFSEMRSFTTAADAADQDGDGVPDSSDNCPNDANPSQQDLDGDGIGDACDATQDACDGGPVTVDSVTFGPGTHRVASAQHIETQGAVQLQAGADVSFEAPILRFGAGFRVAAGAIFAARAGVVSCSAAVSDATAGDMSLAQPAAVPDAPAAEALEAPLPITNPDQLPVWVQDTLALYGVDRDRIEQALLDPQGLWLLFVTAEDILPADRNGVRDIYRLNVFTEALTLLSRNQAGHAGNGPSGHPAADAHGELVVFQSDADDLVDSDGNGVTDIFLHDVAVGQTTRVTAAAATASAHPALDAAGEDLLYDQRDADGQRQILIDGLWDDRLAESLSLIEDSTGLRLDNHHPAISADGRYFAYLEARADDSETACQVHVYDRDQAQYQRTPCPEALADNAESARPYFSPDAAELNWYLPGVDLPVVVPNPLVDGQAAPLP
ncbi:hypothetical protein CKO23_12285 [Thiocystis violacea]|nr:hypothetical protein [Thiocystis violacea]